MIEDKLKPPYYAVIFTTILTDDLCGYKEAAKRMELLAKKTTRLFGY